MNQESTHIDSLNKLMGETYIIKAEPLNYANSSDRKIPIHLTKDKMAYLSYPADINDKDIKLLNHAISGILLKLELEKDDENNNE